MNKEQAEEFTQSLGQICGGSTRQILLAKELGVPKALGLSVEEWVQQRLGGYVRMAKLERVEVVKELSANGHSTQDIAEVVGVSYETIRQDSKKLKKKTEPDARNGDSADPASKLLQTEARDLAAFNHNRRLTLFHALRDTLMGLRFFADSTINLTEFFSIEDRKDFDRFMKDDYTLDKMTPAIDPGIKRLQEIIQQLRTDYEL